MIFGAINSIDTERKLALTDLNVTSAVFIRTATIGKTERSGKIGITELAGAGYGDFSEPADCAGCTDGTQNASCPDGDGFTRFTEYDGAKQERSERVRGDLRDRHSEVG